MTTPVNFGMSPYQAAAQDISMGRDVTTQPVTIPPAATLFAGNDTFDPRGPINPITGEPLPVGQDQGKALEKLRRGAAAPIVSRSSRPEVKALKRIAAREGSTDLDKLDIQVDKDTTPIETTRDTTPKSGPKKQY